MLNEAGIFDHLRIISSSKINDKFAAGIHRRERVNVARRSIGEILHLYVSRMWNRGKAALTALTNDISTTTAASLGFILLDIGAILSRAKTVYSANVVFANVRATKYVTRTYIPLAQLSVDDKKINTSAYIARTYIWNFVSLVTDEINSTQRGLSFGNTWYSPD